MPKPRWTGNLPAVLYLYYHLAQILMMHLTLLAGCFQAETSIEWACLLEEEVLDQELEIFAVADSA